MALASFGSGRLYGTRTDIPNATPIEFGVLQSCDIDMSFSTKPLNGQNQFAVFVARGTAKWTVKAKAGIISGLLFNNIFFGQSMTTGQVALAAGEVHTVPSTSPYTISPTNQSTFVLDEGVTYVGDPGLPLTLTSGAPAASAEYEAPAAPSTTGVYTFSSSDAGNKVLLNYQYSSTAGEQIALSNLITGTTPYFSAVFRNRDPKTGLYDTFVINRATSNKLSIGSKTEDYTLPEFDMEIMDDGTGQIGIFSFGDLS